MLGQAPRTLPRRRPWGEYDEASYQATKNALLELGHGLRDSQRMFGTKEHVDPVRFLIGAASGFGGLPEEEAYYGNKAQALPVGRYRPTVKDPPLDGILVGLDLQQGRLLPGERVRLLQRQQRDLHRGTTMAQ